MVHQKKSEGDRKFKIFFRRGTVMILNKFTVEEAEAKAIKENESVPVDLLAEITDSFGGVLVKDFRNRGLARR